MCATFNSNTSITIISCYSPTNASDEMNINTFYNKLPSLIRHISKVNIITINRDMKAHIGKYKNYKLCLNNSPNTHTHTYIYIYI